VPGAVEDIIDTLAAFGMQSDGKVVWQSHRKDLYEAAFSTLGKYVYPCACSRKEIADSRVALAPDGAAIYPGTCRQGLASGREARAWRLRAPERDDPAALIRFDDRWQGRVEENMADSVGDFVLKRADGFWAYQIAVVVDDADQQVSDIVRGADLLESTARQIYLQQLLGIPTPRFLHVPVVVNGIGEKLSKQTGAVALDKSQPVKELMLAAGRLALPLRTGIESLQDFWDAAVPAWARRFVKI
jgi:glutamyl-Q tRNA(Asp) synthetase